MKMPDLKELVKLVMAAMTDWATTARLISIIAAGVAAVCITVLVLRV